MEYRLGVQVGARWPGFEPQLFTFPVHMTPVIVLIPSGLGSPFQQTEQQHNLLHGVWVRTMGRAIGSSWNGTHTRWPTLVSCLVIMTMYFMHPIIKAKKKTAFIKPN